MTGNISRRGKHSWRLKFDIDRDPITNKRVIRYATVRGSKRQAEQELTRLTAARDAGTMIEPTKMTVAEYVRQWIATAETTSISPKTAERYRQLIENQIVPRLGAVPLQKLRAAHIAAWHGELLKSGGHEGHPLAARTVGHAHRVLHKALSTAAKHELICGIPRRLSRHPKSRNVRCRSWRPNK